MCAGPVSTRLNLPFALNVFPCEKTLQLSGLTCSRRCQRREYGRSSNLNIASCSENAPHNSVTGMDMAHPLPFQYPTRHPSSVSTLSPRHFLNLTNGIEALPGMQSLLPNSALRFTRIQSSHCESGAYDKLLGSLDTELLFALACGRACFVYDFASRNKTRGVPRALFLGVEFVKWSIAYLWYGEDAPEAVPEKVFVRGKNTVPFWRSEVMAFRISKDTKRKVRYFAPFAREMGVSEVKLYGVYGRVSGLDGCKEIHVKMVRDWLEAERLSADNGYEGCSVAGARQWIQHHGYAEYCADSTPEELVSIQEWMGRFEHET